MKDAHAENRAVEHRLAVHTKWGIGLEVSAQTIYEVDRTDMKLLERLKYKLRKLRKSEGIPTVREFDKLYEAHRQTYNEDTPISVLTHAIDYYSWSDGSIQKRYHARKRMKWEGKPISIGMIVNIHTQQRYWIVYDDGKETAFRTAQLIQKALDNGEDIKYVVSDRLYKKTIKAIEDKGVIPVIYPKEKETMILLKGVWKKVKGICYNHNAERQFGNISKVFYAIKSLTTELTWDEAKQLFNAVLGIVWEKDDAELLAWDELYESNRMRVTVTHPTAQPIEEGEEA